MELEFTNLVIVCATAFLAPFLLGLFPAVRLPSVVLELVAGIVIGPAVLGWVEVDEPVAVLATIGLAFLLFLAGLEIEFRKLRGRPLRQASLGYAVSFGIAVVLALLLRGAGIVDTPLLVAIILTATSLGVVVPVLKDAGEISSPFGQLIVAAASIADFAAIFLLSLFFSREATGVGAKLVLIGGFALTVIAIFVFVVGAERSMRLTDVLARLQDTTAQIRVRGAFLLLVGFAAIAAALGLEAILGAFAAGALLTLVDHDQAMTHPQFRLKLESAGFGIFIPVFFVASGLRFDLDALTASASTLARVPLFLAVLLLVRGLPALLYRSTIGGRTTLVAALLQATSLPFIVAATQIGLELGKLNEATAAALVGAGILSVLVFPLLAVVLLKREEPSMDLQAQPVG
jgi:Kef-type K+ transport system membrane component KefB